MNYKTKTLFFSLMIVFMMFLNAMITVPAYADDDLPPTPEPVTLEEETVTTQEEVVSDPVLSVSDETQTSMLSSDTDVSNQEEVAPPSSETSTTELLATLPEATELVVVDSDGQPVPLATNEAAQAVAFIDPIWCPVGVVPKANTGGCSDSFPDLLSLVNGFVPKANGVIWIQFGNDASSGSITIDGTPGTGNWASAANFSLTLNGGWNGIQGTTGTSGVSTFSKNLSIVNWVGAVTLQNITVSGVSVDNPNSGDGCISALCVETKGNVVLNRVVSSNNTTQSGAGITSVLGVGTVKVISSSFENNAGDGLQIGALGGTVTISDVRVANNTLIGLSVFSNKTVTLTGANQFLSNQGQALNVHTNEDFTASNMAVFGNGSVGNLSCAINARNVTLTGFLNYSGNSGECAIDASAQIKASNISAVNNTSTGKTITLNGQLGVTLTGNNNFFNNEGQALEVESTGLITLNNITSIGNQAGVNIIGGLGAVNITGTNTFNEHGSSGLTVTSLGSISLNNVTANRNYGSGIVLNNRIPNATGNITITGYVIAEHNAAGDGIDIFTTGVVNLANASSSYNSGKGLVIENAFNNVIRNVTLTGKNTFLGNLNTGLDVFSYGNVSINLLTASENSADGAYILIATPQGTTIKPSLTLTGVTLVNSNADYGLNITAPGNMSAAGITANGNGIGGAAIFNSGSLTLLGTNQFNDNGVDGLNANSNGTVLIQNLTARNNQIGFGVSLETGILKTSLIIKGYIFTENNGKYGLLTSGSGLVTIENLSSNYNGAEGAVILNAFDSKISNPVTLSGNNQFIGNGSHGLEIISFGNILINNLTATGNGHTPVQGTSNLSGVYLSTSNQVSNSSVTLTGINTITSNGDTVNHIGDGIIIFADGNAVLSNLTVDGNAGDGAGIFIDGNLTLTGTNSFSHNYVNGLEAGLKGFVQLASVSANDNGQTGVMITNNYNPLLPQNVTMTGINILNHNGYNGLQILSFGVVTLNNITASDNGRAQVSASGFGAVIDNCALNANVCTAVSPKNVVLLGNNVFDGNFSSGLSIQSLGAIQVNNISANRNGVHGAFLKNKFTSSIQQSVVVTGSGLFNFNGSRGLLAESFGSITLANITATRNGHRGVSLDNTGGLLAKNIDMTGSNNFVSNALNGLFFNTDGNFTLTRVTASYNGTSGAGRGIFGTAKGAITITCGTLFMNKDWGYNLTSNVSITLKGIISFANPNGDAFSAPKVDISSACPLP